MLLDIGSVLGGFALAVVAFLVVILVCVIILRLLAVILPEYQGPYSEAATPDEPAPAEADGAGDPLPGAQAAGDASADPEG